MEKYQPDVGPVDIKLSRWVPCSCSSEIRHESSIIACLVAAGLMAENITKRPRPDGNLRAGRHQEPNIQAGVGSDAGRPRSVGWGPDSGSASASASARRSKG